MVGALSIYRSTIGKKAIMAITGFIWVGFVFIHMIGNLKMYFGAHDYNIYGEFLRTVGYPLFPERTLLWIARIVIFGAVALHIWAAAALTNQARTSRPAGYKQSNRAQPLYVYASRTMRWGGIIIALFIVYHILHFTTGTLHNNFIHGDVYHNVVAGFSIWWVSLIYIVAMGALGLHLFHGVWSMFQTIGWNNSGLTNFWRWVALIFTAVVIIGNISFPLAVLVGVVAPETATTLGT
ncbi:MAG: succinate dehydrogenase cytochrome b subunit [Chloroflexaceae bacterium]